MGYSKEEIVINDNYSQYKHFLSNLPDIFHKEGEVLYKGRNTIKVFDMDEIRINVKSFRIPHLLNQFVYTLFRDSKANRSYHYALKLIERGVETPTPIAYMEFHAGLLLKESMYVSKQILFDGEMRVLQRGSIDQHRELIIAFARYTAHLHDKQVLHLDYSSGNILFKKEGGTYHFYLVDLNRMKFDCPITAKEAAYNFRRLWGSDEMISLFVNEYASARKLDAEQCLQYTFEYRYKFWKKFSAKYPDAAPYK